MNTNKTVAILISLFIVSFTMLGQNKNAEPYDIYDYVGKPKALADIEGFSKRSKPIYDIYLQGANIPYGLSKREIFDYFYNPTSNKADGVFIFIHGGYWQGGLKESYAFVGKWFLENNIDLILIEYDLTKENELNGETLPRATMTAIAGEVGRALDHIQTFLAKNTRVSLDTPIFLSGHSAGGHLAALHKAHPLINTAIFPISGLFDLSPIAPTKVIGKALQLNETEIINLSPIYNINNAIPSSPAIYIYYGGIEMPELINQSVNYYNKIKKHGYKTSIQKIEGADHFEILDQLFNNPSSPLINEVERYKKEKSKDSY